MSAGILRKKLEWIGIQTILRLIHVANWATENTCTFECFQFIKATSPIDKDANQTHLIGLRKLTSSKHGGKRDVVHTNITGEDGGDLGILHRVGGGGSLGGDTAVGHGRLGGEGNKSRPPGLGGHRRGEGIGAREEGDGAEGNSRESHLDGSIVEENADDERDDDGCIAASIKLKYELRMLWLFVL